MGGHSSKFREERQCRLCGRQHEVADDGTIQTWVVTWGGQEIPHVQYLSSERHKRLTGLAPNVASTMIVTSTPLETFWLWDSQLLPPESP